MSVRNKFLFFFILMNLLFLPAISKAVYNLSSFYANISQLVYSFVGNVPSSTTGFIMNGVFYNNSQDGQFNPGILAIDLTHDRLYVVDNFAVTAKVQRYVLSTGAFDGAIGSSTVANGTCVAGPQPTWCTGGDFISDGTDGSFNYITDVKLDVTNDFMYVADNLQVSKFRLSTGAFIGAIGSGNSASGTCIAGPQAGWCAGGTYFDIDTTDGGFNYVSSLAIDPTNDFFYVLDGSYRIQKFILSSGAFVGTIGNGDGAGTCALGAQTTWCTGGTFSLGTVDGTFDQSLSIEVDSLHNYLYVADDLNRRIQRFTLSTGAFAGAIGNSTANGTCVSGKQTSWCTGGVFSSGTGDGMFRGLADVKADPVHDRLYVSEYDTERVEQFVLSTGAFIGIIGSATVSAGTCSAGAQMGWCSGGDFNYGFLDGEFVSIGKMFIETTNNILYVASGSQIERFNAATGAFTGAMGASVQYTPNWSQGPGYPISVANNVGGFSDASDMAIDSVNDRIYSVKYTSIEKSVLSTGAYIGSIGNSNKAAGTCALGKQNSWCAGGSFTAVHSDGGFSSAEGIAIDVASDRMYIVNSDDSSIQKLVLSTGAFIGSIGRSIASGTCVAGKQSNWCAGGSFSYGTGDGHFGVPKKVAIDVAGDRMYVLELNDRIQKFVLSTGAFIGSIGYATSSSGSCVVGLQSNWCTGGVFNPSTVDGSLSSSSSFVIDTVGNSIIVSQFAGGKIAKFVLSTGVYVGAIGNSTASGTCLAGMQNSWCTGGNFTYGYQDGMFQDPKALSIDQSQDLLYITDDVRNIVQKFTLSTGAFIGAIGGSTVSGNCLAGKQKEWCVGGNFYTANVNGFFNYPRAIVVDPLKKRLFLLDLVGLHKITW